MRELMISRILELVEYERSADGIMDFEDYTEDQMRAMSDVDLLDYYTELYGFGG